MNKTVPKKPTRRMKTVTDQRELILWLSAEAKAGEPQVDLPKPMVWLFDTVVSAFADTGVLEPPWDWNEWLRETLPEMYSPDTELCSAKVSWLATDCYAELINRRERLQADYFIKALAHGVLGSVMFSDEGYLTFTKKGALTDVRSTAAFHREYGFKIRVNVRRPVPRPVPRRWGMAHPAAALFFKDLE
ncbi:hypothetical protein [Mesorhizobium sp.]|uniref:hypothetical protein n=1 Tax=Mesorhizobium sp. TaxID=1871066 RepID=UPI00120BC7A2|nr:hypothetical protein [Mesorhizobium sp.]TIM05492.1 MAG: hypothetical protein E5Y62_27250 [Mesorhizobium sp.]